MATTPVPPQAAAREAAPRPPVGAAVVAAVVGVLLAGAIAVWQPLAGIGLAILVLIGVLLRDVPVRRLAPVLIILAALAAIGGPNLAAPAAPGVFLFRILIVVIGVGVVGYLLMDGGLSLPAALPRPAGLLGVWILWSALSILWSEDMLAALRWTSFLAMMSGLAIGIALICRERRRAQILLWSLMGAFALACLVAVAEVLTGMHLPTFRAGVENRGGLIGVGSLFGNQNNFAMFLSIALPYFAALPVVYRDVRLRFIGLGGSAVALIFMLLTGSKSGLISSGLILIGLLLLVGTDRNSRGRLLVAGGIAALAVLLVVPMLSGGGVVKLDQRTVTKLDVGLLNSQRESGTGSGAVRDALLNDGLSIVGETNGLGVGAGNAETRVRALADFPGVANLHNWWLEVLVDGGVVGLALYVAFFWTLLRGQARAARRSADPLVRYMSLAGALSLIGWIVGSLGPSTAIHFAPMWIMFGLGMGSLVLARRAAELPRGVTPSAS
ncbi:MAG: O-antigen ligase family protein [Thermoleophilia bacterium]